MVQTLGFCSSSKMLDKAPSMTVELDIARLIIYTTSMGGPTFTALTVRQSPALVTYLCVVCAGKTIAEPIYCKDIDLLAPDYRLTIHSQLGDTCNPTAPV